MNAAKTAKDPLELLLKALIALVLIGIGAGGVLLFQGSESFQGAQEAQSKAPTPMTPIVVSDVPIHSTAPAQQKKRRKRVVKKADPELDMAVDNIASAMPAPEPEPEQEEVRITFNLAPANALVAYRGQVVRGGLTIPKGPTEHVVEIWAEGYQMKRQLLLASESRTVAVALEPVAKPIPPKPAPKKPKKMKVTGTGFIKATSDMWGIEIQIDSKKVGMIPLDPVAVSAGRHMIWAYMEGFEIYTRDVFVKPNQTFHQQIVLIPIPPPVVDAPKE